MLPESVDLSEVRHYASSHKKRAALLPQTQMFGTAWRLFDAILSRRDFQSVHLVVYIVLSLVSSVRTRERGQLAARSDV
ncbi:hypothetical protein OH76DRAFT_1401362 [Lentinus brumalis]|uniref:Uncharacterized protein n=1 Tax=Lentinus brumalis TaxID=2498619 RepID=A0A371DG20_9APHY|nr:hypothetical protein OH76DRAFT_1401362 [Polyporus brumalis]